MNGPSSITGLSDNVGASAEALNNAGRHIETLTAKINDQAQDLQALTTKCGNLELAAKEFADHTARDEAAKNALAEAVAGLKQVVMDPQRAKAAEKTADKKPTDAETLEALASKVDNQAADFRTLASVCMEIRVAIAGSDEVQAPEGLVEKIDALISICKGIEGASTSCQHSEAVNTLPDNMESLTSVCQEIKAALAGSDEAQAPEGLVSRTESLTSVCAEIKSATEGPAKAVENLAEKIDLSGSKLDAIGETHAELSNLASTLKRRLDDDEEMRETKRRRLAHPLSECQLPSPAISCQYSLPTPDTPVCASLQSRKQGWGHGFAVLRWACMGGTSGLATAGAQNCSRHCRRLIVIGTGSVWASRSTMMARCHFVGRNK
ncbi:hypothetical protein B0T16DRAFT_422417 [Cercophora newfieldiana]|uniref:Uncharacterized protein n=1 Tax=Cercophora newfieldiana TaxID=92897 RepID=A0AA39XRW5_9PEZI|nr:hypothetical protein B0T16DRAFT_422417 [Cercophora newfieldiana]